MKEISDTGSPVVARSITWNPYPNDNLKNPGKLTQDYLWAVSFMLNVMT